MGIEHVYKGCKNKAEALIDFMSTCELQSHEVCFIGDDVNDIPAMEIAGFVAAPVNAMGAVKERAHFISNKRGGDGAVRELLEHLMGARALAMEAAALWAS
jgi:3-deoxy-D-manno-octulosonate 8-phosphate phosphatase (KDO 8-P phosphatase)